MTAFETIVCSRCGGSGKHSWCSTHRDVCFKCHGSGKVFSARAIKAKAWLREKLMVPIEELELGTRVSIPGIGRFTVKSKTESASKWMGADGEWHPFLEIKGDTLAFCGCPGHTKIERVPTKAELAEAIEFMNKIPVRKGKKS